ncbi:MAG: hypothetical protein PSX71_10690 [bacterium]|nr:hypothetical protein [bacterium]
MSTHCHCSRSGATAGFLRLPALVLMAGLLGVLPPAAFAAATAATAGTAAPSTDTVSPASAGQRPATSPAFSSGKSLSDAVGAFQAIAFQSVFPAMWTAGSHYSVMLNGTNFLPGMELRFGSGVVVGKPLLLGGTTMKIDVTVADTADSGSRLLEWRAGMTQPWQMSSLSVMVYAKPKPAMQPVQAPEKKPVQTGFMPLPKFTEPPAFALTPGKIVLEKPQWQFGGSFGGENASKRSPLIDDATVFTWKEENPGLADAYEIRILTLNKKVLVTRRINPVTLMLNGNQTMLPAQTWYRPDAKLLDELLDPNHGQAPLAIDAGATGTQTTQHTSMPMGGAQSGGSQPAPVVWPDGTQYLWDVIGYKRVPKPKPQSQQQSAQQQQYAQQSYGQQQSAQQAGQPYQQAQVQNAVNAVQEMIDVEVSLSEQWPLMKPARPNGLQACPIDGKGVTIYNMTQGNQGVPHPGDQWILSGTFSLGKSPYAMVSQEVKEQQAAPKGPGGQMGVGLEVVTEHHFDNVFIDWGDGSGAQPISVRSDMTGIGDHAVNRAETYKLPDAAEYLQWKAGKIPADKDSPQYLTHSYAIAGNYNVRLFQLSEGDVQKTDPGMLAASVDGNGNNAYLQVAQTGMAARQSTKAVIAERAYLVYCHAVKVEPWMDTIANGYLQLKSVAVKKFGAQASSAAQAKSPGTVETAEVHAGAINSSNAAVQKSNAVLLAGGKKSYAPLPGKPGAPDLSSSDAPQDYASHVQLQAAYSVDAICSGCNKAWSARAILEYTGAGHVDATWWVKLRNGGAAMALSDEGVITVPASPSRTGNPANWGAPITGKFELVSPRLPIDPTDIYEVWVSVQVKPAPVTETFGALLSGNSTINPAQFASALKTEGSELPKFGLLNPMTTGGGMAAAVYGPGNTGGSNLSGLAGALLPEMAQAQQNAAGALLQPPNFVKSETKSYKVIAIDESKLCELKFAGASGDYPMYVDQAKLPKMVGDNIYTGTATLDLSLAVSPSAVKNIAVPVSFTSWKVGTDGRIASGSVLKPMASGEDIHPRGLEGTLRTVAGVAGKDIDATLKLSPSDALIHYTKNGNAVAPAWEMTAPLSVKGDWLATTGPENDLALGWSGFYLSTPKATLDLSRAAGSAPAGCNDGSGNGWTGLNFGDAKIRLNTRDLVTAQVNAPGWGVSSRACGHLDVQNDPALQHLVVGKGEISFRRVRIDALPSGGFKAIYAMDVKVPFLDASLHGDDVTLVSTGSDEGSFDFSGLKPDADVVRNFGPVHLRVPKQSVLFGPAPAGWRVLTAPELTTDAEGKPFLAQAVTIPNMSFGLNGRAFFSDTAEPVRTMNLSQMASLGKTPIELSGLRLDGGTTGSERLKLNFFGDVKLSAGLPGSPVQVNYAITGDNYAGSGPWNSPFSLSMSFPQAQPAMENTVAPVYSPDPQGGTRYSGDVDIGLFGGPPVKAQFLLGYSNNTDYWLMRASMPMGSTGIVLYPEVVSLFAIRGGMGYHVQSTSFAAATPLKDIQPDPGTGLLFSAGVRLGSADQFIYTLDGDLVGTTSGIVRADFGAWLLNPAPSGQPPIKGYIQYGGGNLDGRMWGHIGYLGDLISFDLGKSENNAAMQLHFGDGDWYLNAGNKDGARISAFVLVQQSDSYLMLGSATGFAVGGAQSLYLGVGDDSFASAYVKGYLDVGLQITPQPKVIGDFAAGAEAGVCVAGGCADASVTADVHAEAMPVEIRAHATVGFPYPLPDVSFTVHL